MSVITKTNTDSPKYIPYDINRNMEIMKTLANTPENIARKEAGEICFCEMSMESYLQIQRLQERSINEGYYIK